MDNPVARIRFWLKRGLAVILFVTLLVGASATAFYALAAGISALSGFATHAQVTPGTFGQPQGGSATGAVALPNSTASGSNITSSPSGALTGTNVANDNSEASSGSPLSTTVGAAIDGGGFALGNRIEQGFGSILGGVLDTLFLDQPSRSNGTGGTGSGQYN